MEEQKDVLILAIESSCDETAAAVVKNGRTILSNVINSQIAIHTEYGGVVPEIASRKHIENINPVIRMALDEAKVTLDDIDAIGVTYGPGLVGALLVGVAEAKAIAFATGKPLGNIGRALHVLDTEEFKDMLNDTMNVITHMKSMEIYEVVSYAKSLTKYKNEIYDFLDIIMVWYRDMLILKTTGSLNQLVFKDKYRQLKDQEIYISFEGISHILDEVEKARRRLIANVNFEVAIEMLLVTIKENGKVW